MTISCSVKLLMCDCAVNRNFAKKKISEIKESYILPKFIERMK